jgi:hypothetical protein
MTWLVLLFLIVETFAYIFSTHIMVGSESNFEFGFGSFKMVRIFSDSDPQHCFCLLRRGLKIGTIELGQLILVCSSIINNSNEIQQGNFSWAHNFLRKKNPCCDLDISSGFFRDCPSLPYFFLHFFGNNVFFYNAVPVLYLYWSEPWHAGTTSPVSGRQRWRARSRDCSRSPTCRAAHLRWVLSKIFNLRGYRIRKISSRIFGFSPWKIKIPYSY